MWVAGKSSKRMTEGARLPKNVLESCDSDQVADWILLIVGTFENFRRKGQLGSYCGTCYVIYKS